MGGTNVTYLPKPDYAGSDLITYTLGDPYTTVTATIYIHVLSYGDLTNSIVGITNQGGGAITLTFTGIPGWTYWMLDGHQPAGADVTGPPCPPTPPTPMACGSSRTLARPTPRDSTAWLPTNPPDFQMYDTELLRLDHIAGGRADGHDHSRKPHAGSPWRDPNSAAAGGHFYHLQLLRLFTEVSVNSGLIWFPATNGSIPLFLVGGTPPNGFPTDSLPPPLGQYITPPCWPEIYQPPAGQSIVITNLTLHDFTAASPPPPPGVSSTNSFDATADLFVSRDGGHTFSPFPLPPRSRCSSRAGPAGSSKARPTLSRQQTAP